ncbi:MAG: trypsin-like peptidase domain-containing protein [Blastocatellia bacterium]|nr:trypsin-like peptidase domain-containing protein [Blastocatellia bacterium]
MHYAIRITFLLVSALFLTTSLLAQKDEVRSPKSPSEIAREQSKAVVVLEGLDDRNNVVGQGSGFIVTPNGAIVTNLHVVRGASMVLVKLPSGDMYKTVDVVDVDDVKDLVVLKIKGFQLPTVRLGDSDRVEAGESVVVISSPEGLTNSVTTGVLSGVRRLETHRVFQITAPTSPGSSGGALFDSSGSVVGIVTYVLRSGQNINFAVPVNYVRGMISDQVKSDLSRIQPGNENSAGPPAESAGQDEKIDGQLVNVSRGRLGLTPQEPMFGRPFEALSFLNRLVDSIGKSTLTEVGELTRTAALVKTKETNGFDEYTIKYVSSNTGVALTFSKPERVLASVEWQVNWSITDLENTFGNKYKKRKAGNDRILDFGKLPSGKRLVALMDGNGSIRSVRFTNANN